MTRPINRIAVVGTGVIGASWAALFLSRGLEVVATDPAPGAEARLRALVEDFWPALARIGMVEGATTARLRFEPDLARTVAGADFIQENGPERVDVKRSLLAAIDAAADPDVIIATSSSGILISAIQDAASRPERVLLGHPFNPPHLIPLVEVVGGKLTSHAAIDVAMGFYADIGKKPIHIRREVPGHVANRLQAALWREAFHLLEEGVASVADIDTAIAHGPGLRWALLGPFLNLHLSGGAAGIGHTIDHLGPPIESWWQDLGHTSFTPELREAAIKGVAAEIAAHDFAETVRQRDDVLISLLANKAASDQLP
jgi:carnitine 3-dehydrogenase